MNFGGGGGGGGTHGDSKLLRRSIFSTAGSLGLQNHGVNNKVLGAEKCQEKQEQLGLEALRLGERIC